MSIKKNKPIVTDIKLPKAKQDKLNSILNSSKYSEYRKSIYQRHIVGVCRCGNVPTKIISFDVDGASLIEKYCDKCFAECDKNERRR